MRQREGANRLRAEGPTSGAVVAGFPLHNQAPARGESLGPFIQEGRTYESRGHRLSRILGLGLLAG